MPAATLCGSALLANSACWALSDGSSVLVGGAPGSGGRRAKSGGITSGALVVTANSSGDFFSRPAAWRRESQPLSADKATPRARMVVGTLISNLLARTLRGLWLQHIIQDGHRPQRDRQIGNIEDIPVIAETVKVEKIRHFAVDHPVHQIVAQSAPDDQAIADGQRTAGGAPQKPAQHGH